MIQTQIHDQCREACKYSNLIVLLILYQWPAGVLLLSNLFSINNIAAIVNIIMNLWKPICQYSRASDNGPSEKRTTSLQQTSAVLPIEFSIVIVH